MQENSLFKRWMSLSKDLPEGFKRSPLTRRNFALLSLPLAKPSKNDRNHHDSVESKATQPSWRRGASAEHDELNEELEFIKKNLQIRASSKVMMLVWALGTGIGMSFATEFLSVEMGVEALVWVALRRCSNGAAALDSSAWIPSAQDLH